MANAELIIFGTPYGEQTSVCDNATQNFLGRFYIPNSGIQRKMYTKNKNETHLILLDYGKPGAGIMDSSGRSGGYFGMDFILRGQYAADPMRIFQLMTETYEKYVLNRFIQTFPNGNRKWLTNNLRADNDAIAKEISEKMQELSKARPELNLAGAVKPITPPAPQIQHDRD